MKQAFNPFLPLDEYIPDGEPHVFGDRVYIFGSHDKEGGETFCMLDYVTYSADVNDLSDWRFEGTIYSSSQDPHSQDVLEDGGQRKYMYAPDVVQGNDGRYYLYYCLSGHAGKGGFDGPISVAVCDTPGGRYEYLGDVQYPDGRTMLRYIPFDPAVINDSGKVYLYYGWALPVKPTKNKLVIKALQKVMKNMFHKSLEEIKTEPFGIMGANVVELEDDMITVKGEPKRILPCELMAKGTGYEGHAFFEASSIRKIGDTYYFVYSSTDNHELAYATSKYPDRGFVYGGAIISNGDIGYNGRKHKDRLCQTGTNHGGIECINGEYYIFYHRNTHMSGYSRQACAERIEIGLDGSIKQVEMTSCGLNGKPLKPKGEYPAAIACNLTDGRMPHITNGIGKNDKPRVTHGDGERYIANIGRNTMIGYKYFGFDGETAISVKTRGRGKGKLLVSCEPGDVLGEIIVMPSEGWQKAGTTIKAECKKSLYFTYKGKGKIDMLSFAFGE